MSDAGYPARIDLMALDWTAAPPSPAVFSRQALAPSGARIGVAAYPESPDDARLIMVHPPSGGSLIAADSDAQHTWPLLDSMFGRCGWRRFLDEINGQLACTAAEGTDQ